METLHNSIPISSLLSITNKNMRRNTKQNHHYRNRRHHRPSQKLTLFSKPTPTPLQTHQPPTTKHQALHDVVRDIESSISNGVVIDRGIFSSLLETCFQMDQFAHGIRLRYLIPPRVLRESADLSSKLLRLYAVSGLINEAHKLFDEMPQRKRTAFAWNSLISGYCELGMFEDALALYYQMEEDGVEPDGFTFPRVLKACAGLGSIELGLGVHRHAVRVGLADDLFVLNALIDMYAKCGDISKACRAFDAIREPDAISWSSILTGYARHGLHFEALRVFRKMVWSGSESDHTSISTILSGLSTTHFGFQVHGWALRRGLNENISVANALITMYSNNGLVSLAWEIFKAMPVKDVVSWNAIIYAHRADRKALDIFEMMEDSSTQPDYITFISLLSTCANLGLVETGLAIFDKFEEKYKIEAGMEHYSCMVTLLGRAGLIEEAYELILNQMPFEAGPTVWGSLLFCCSLHGNVKVAEVAAQRLFELEPDNAHNFELLAKIYKNAGRRKDEENVRKMMISRGLDL